MASSYEAAARLNGEIRIYLETASQIDVHGVKAQLQYSSRIIYHRSARTRRGPSGFGAPPVNQTRSLIGDYEKHALNAPTLGLRGWSATLWATRERVQFRAVLAISRKVQCFKKSTRRSGPSSGGGLAPRARHFKK
jgi:hypothetical protein